MSVAIILPNERIETDMPAQTAASFADTLRHYWGYEAFRPGQEAIVRSIAAGRESFVVMPTGGGKSLCSQLPAVPPSPPTPEVSSPPTPPTQHPEAPLLPTKLSPRFAK